MNLRKILSLIFVIILLFSLASPVFAEGGEEAVNFGFWSLLPPLVAIVLAFVTKQVILSLFLGILVGATMMQGGNIFFGFLRTLDAYILGSAADSWNAAILIFTLTIGGMIGVISKMGGTHAIAESLAKKAKTARSAQIVTWAMGCLVFFDDYANTLIVGPTMRPLTDKMKVSREKLSYIVDSTAAPVAGMAVISTWVGYELGLINDAFTAIGIEASAYEIFLRSIPYRFYDIFAIVMVFLVAYMLRDFGPMYAAEKRARLTGKVLADGANPMSSTDMEREIPKGTVLKVSNAVIPIMTLVIVSFVGLWYSGGGTELPMNMEGIRTAFGDADASVALIWGSASASIVAIVLAISQKILTIGEAFDSWVDGAKSLVITAIILVFAWSIGSVAGDVGTANYLISVVTDTLPPFVLPLLVFAISCVVAFATGTSWGTMAIMMPLAIPLAAAFNGNIIDNLMLATLSAVLTGSIFGDHCSPISDTTIMSSMASAADHIDHVKTQLPYALFVAVTAIIVGYLPAGLGLNPLLSLVAGVLIIWAVLKFYGKSTAEEDLKLLDKGKTA